MVTSSSVLAWKIPLTEEPSELYSMRSQRVEHDLMTEHIKHVGSKKAVIHKCIESDNEWNIWGQLGKLLRSCVMPLLAPTPVLEVALTPSLVLGEFSGYLPRIG